jgi:hypothetical protein
VVTDVQASAANRHDRFRMKTVPEVQEELLRLALGVAGVPPRVESRPPAADPLLDGMEPDQHSLAPRARLAMQDRDMELHGIPPRCRSSIFSVRPAAAARIGGSTDCDCLLLPSLGWRPRSTI